MQSHSLLSDRSPLDTGSAGRGAATRYAFPTSLQRPLVGHTEELAALRRSLRVRGVSGSVLVGAPGVGKTSLLRAAQDSLPGEYFVRVRGLRSAASLPYRAVNFLLAQIPAELSHPPLLPTALAAYLREQAAGKPLVFAVDNGEHLDAASASLIGQLVTNGTARLLLTVRDFAQLDPVFSALWRGGRLQRLDVGALSVGETRQLLEAELGAPLSRAVLDHVWDAGLGNPEVSRATLLGLVEQGLLERHGPAWVLVGNVDADTASDSAARGRLLTAALAPSECEALKLLALAGPSPWAHLIRLVAARDLDALQGLGLLTVETQRHPVFSVANPRRVRDLLEDITAAEAAALYSRYTAVSGAARRLEADVVRHVVWALKAQLPVSEEQLAGAAAILNDEGRYDHAAELIQRSTQEHVVAPAVALQGAVAALGQGRYRTAQIFGIPLGRVTEQPDPGFWVQCRLQLSRIQRRRSPGEAAATLDAAAHRVDTLRDAADAVDVPALTRLARLIGAEQAELASFEGRYGENLATVPALLGGKLPASSAREDRELQVTLQSLLLEAHAHVDQRAAGAALLYSFAANLSSPDVSHRVADAALQRVELAALLTGGWSEGARPLQELSVSSERWSLRHGSPAELLEGISLVNQDRARDAVAVLGPAVEQLREVDPHGFLPVAAAALTYCHAQLESREQMIAHLPVPNAGGRPWAVRRATRHFQLLSVTGTEGRTDVARLLQECAAEDLAVGATSWALIALSEAVRLGRVEALDELRRVAGTLQGPLARINGLYARALLEADRGALVEAMQQAVTAGFYRFAMDIAQSGITAATGAQDRAGIRFLQRKLRQLLPEGLGRGESYESFNALTAREREIALLTASGRSNKVIAETLFVSVRTVEGHLYQVYSKLNVSTRAELAECIPPMGTP